MVRIKRILHPSDFSRASGGAFAKAVQLAKDNRAELVVMHALALPSPLVPGEGYIAPAVYDEMERSSRAWPRDSSTSSSGEPRRPACVPAPCLPRGLPLTGSPAPRVRIARISS